MQSELQQASSCKFSRGGKGTTNLASPKRHNASGLVSLTSGGRCFGNCPPHSPVTKRVLTEAGVGARVASGEIFSAPRSLFHPKPGAVSRCTPQELRRSIKHRLLFANGRLGAGSPRRQRESFRVHIL